MVLNIRQRVSLDEFEQFIATQETDDFEFIGGEIVQVVSHSYASYIAARLLIRIGMFVEAQELGYLTGADGDYAVGDERYLPDVGFISKERLTTPPHETYISLAPDLAVEVKTPTDREQHLTVKVSNYLAAGTVVWVVYPDEQEIHVHRPAHSVEIFSHDAVLHATGVLAGFTLKIADIFRQQA